MTPAPLPDNAFTELRDVLEAADAAYRPIREGHQPDRKGVAVAGTAAARYDTVPDVTPGRHGVPHRWRY